MILSGFENPGIFTEDMLRVGKISQILYRNLSRFSKCWSNAYLLVDGWIPVAVVEDDRVRSGQVDAQAPGSGRQQEHKDVLSWI